MGDSVKVTVYDNTGATLLGTFDSASSTADHYGPLSVHWTDVLNSAGSGEVVLALADPAVTSSICAYRNIVKIAVNGGADVYAFRVKDISRDHVVSGGIAAQTVSLSGPGLFDLLSDAVVYPETGLRQSMTGRRSFGWMSAPGAWYSAADFAQPMDYVAYNNVTSLQRAGYPDAWPDVAVNAEWLNITGQGYGINLFRRTFTTTVDKLARIYASSDEDMRLFLDGELLIRTDTDEIGFRQANTYDLTLKAGTHTLAVEMLTRNSVVNGDGIDALLVAVCELDNQGDPTAVIEQTSHTTWLVGGVHPGDPRPGYSLGGILRQLVTEAQARSVTALTSLTFGFSDGTDSKGIAWPAAARQERAFDILRTLVDVAGQMIDGGCDVWVTPALALEAAALRGTTHAFAVADAGTDLLTCSSQGQDETVTFLVSQTQTGFTTYSASTLAAFGRVEAGFSTQSATVEDGPEKPIAATVAEMSSPTCTTTSTMVRPARVPYIDYGLGDYVQDVNQSGVAGAARVTSVAGEWGSSEVIQWTVETRQQ